MKLLITTRADNNFLNWIDLTHPIIRDYAHKIKADFFVLDEQFDIPEAGTGIGLGVYQYRIMEHYNLHQSYDRILHLDSDMILMPNCPNLFEVVPENSIGTIYEDKGSRAPQRIKCINNSRNQFGNIDWSSGYINTGVFVTSKVHKNIYQKINNQYFTAWGTDDIHLGYQINKFGFDVKELSYKFNHMTMFSEPWNNSADRFDSYIIHYAGRGVFDSQHKNKLEQAKSDFKRIYG
jgi:lipopolysaccharide biosynthesis glycosyltransferase